MKKDKKKPHGHTYRANNVVNDKNYIGQTVDSRWSEDQNAIQERWKEEFGDAYRNYGKNSNRR